MKALGRNKSQRPIDLPKRYHWARDEIVRLRVENDSLQKEVSRYKYEKLSSLALAHLLRQAKTMPTLDELSEITGCDVGPHGSISLTVLDCEGDRIEFIFDPEERVWVTQPL